MSGQIAEHQARCTAPLISLRMLAHGEAEEPVPRRVVVEIALATRAVVAEAEAAGCVAVAGGSISHPGGRIFLQARLDRLAAAADETIAAARAGHSAEMRRHLLRFDALTTAIWTVQDAVFGA
jgi:hypothetical protein